MMCVRVLVVLAVAVLGLSAAAEEAKPSNDSSGWWDSGITVVQRSLQECEAARDVSSCLKIKAVRAVDRALHTGQWQQRKCTV